MSEDFATTATEFLAENGIKTLLYRKDTPKLGVVHFGLWAALILRQVTIFT
jgi:hypothetical protein